MKKKKNTNKNYRNFKDSFVKNEPNIKKNITTNNNLKFNIFKLIMFLLPLYVIVMDHNNTYVSKKKYNSRGDEWDEDDPYFKFFENQLILAFIFHDIFFVTLNQVYIPNKWYGYIYSIISSILLILGHFWGCSWPKKDSVGSYITNICDEKITDFIINLNSSFLLYLHFILRIFSFIYIIIFIINDLLKIKNKKNKKSEINNLTYVKLFFGLFALFILLVALLLKIFSVNVNIL